MSKRNTDAKQISDYLHLYLGCEVMTPAGQGKLFQCSYELEMAGIVYGIMGPDFEEWVKHEDIKPILRPLSDMTEEEGIDAEKEWNNGRRLGESISQALNIANAFRIKHLLSKHFDLFGLIESGLAIDKTKHPTP